MKFDEYQKLAKRTINDKDDDNLTLMNFSMGLAGESGETVDYLKKVLFHDHLYNEDVVIKELGDVLWYVAGICTMLEISLEEVAEKNIDKLKKRYPEGFNQYNSINREE